MVISHSHVNKSPEGKSHSNPIKRHKIPLTLVMSHENHEKLSVPPPKKKNIVISHENHETWLVFPSTDFHWFPMKNGKFSQKNHGDLSTFTRGLLDPKPGPGATAVAAGSRGWGLPGDPPSAATAGGGFLVGFYGDFMGFWGDLIVFLSDFMDVKMIQLDFRMI